MKSNVFKFLLLIVFVLFLSLFIFFLRENIFLFFQNLRFALLNASHKELSYQKLLEFKLNTQFNSLKNDKNCFQKIENFKFFNVLIYSKYPFNDFSEVTISAGLNDGIKENMPVFLGNSIIFGIVNKVNKNTSNVMTIFNPNWKSTVFLGENKVKGLLVGGINPEIQYIENKNIEANNDGKIFVYNSDERFPINFVLGEAQEFEEDKVWKKAKFAPIYDFNTLRELNILVNF